VEFGVNEIREMADTAFAVTSTMWATDETLPLDCDRDGVLNAKLWREEYHKGAFAMSSDATAARGGRDYRVGLPRDEAAQAADGACLYAQVLSAMLGLHPKGIKPHSGKTYNVNDLKSRNEDAYEDMNALFQGWSMAGVGASPFVFSCSNMPSSGHCDHECRNKPGCTGDPNGATIVYQFRKTGVQGDSDGYSKTSEFPRIMLYERALELSAKTDAERAKAYAWNEPILFTWGGYWGGGGTNPPSVESVPGDNGEPCVQGYHLVAGTQYCVPDDLMPECETGFVLVGEFCGPCPVNSKYDVNLKLCLTCDPGTAQAKEGQTVCDFCPRGRISNSTHRSCLACEPGTYSSFVGLSECTSCMGGEYANGTGNEACKKCSLGMFSPNVASTGCSMCPRTMVTMVFGATSAEECVCEEGTYLPKGGATCVSCPQGMVCPSASKEANLPKWQRVCAESSKVPCSFPTPSRGFFNENLNPMSIYKCLNVEYCPGGIEACAQNLEGLVCGRCTKGFFKTKTGCSQCTAVEESGGIFPTLPILLAPPIIVFLYRGSRSPIDAWDSFGNGVNSIFTVAIMYAQTLSLANNLQTGTSAASRSYTEGMAWVDVFIDLMSLFRPSCFIGGDFSFAFVSKIVAPVVVAFFFASMKVGSMLIATAAPAAAMDSDILISVYGAVFTCFNIGIAMQSFSLMQCYGHPNGKTSLRSSPDVLCGSDTWTSLLVVAIPAILIFVVGYCVIISWAIARAPSRVHFPVFRTRWKFLFVKFRPSFWWWSLSLFGKSIALSVTSVLFQNSNVQSVWICCVMLIYVFVTSIFLPWRNIVVAAEDVISNFLLVATLACLMSKAPVFPLELILALLPMVQIPILIVLVHYRSRHSDDPRRRAEKLERLFEKFNSWSMGPEAYQSLATLPFLDRFTLELAGAIVAREVGGEMLSGSLQRISSKTPGQTSSAKKAGDSRVVDV